MDLFSELTPATTILTPNSRLTAVFNKKFNLQQMQSGKSSWLALDILSIKNWVQRCWFAYTAATMDAAPLLLSQTQEQVLWETILRRAPESDYLLQISKTAELAQAAWGILKQWRVDLTHPELATTEDSAIFQTWAREFANKLAEQDWLDTNSIADQLIEKITAGKISAPTHLVLAGFTEITPQYQQLFTTCETYGCRITHFEPEVRHNRVNRISLIDQQTEITTMARWAKAHFEASETATVCCVVPALESLREQILPIFCAVFSPATTYVTDHTKLPFNISAGKNLSRYPLIHTALQLLALDAGNIDLEIICQLLRSPFLAGAETEMFVRAELANSLRNDNLSQISLTALCTKPAALACPLLMTALQTYLQNLPDKTRLAPVSHWINVFMQNLTVLGWPGERSLDSAEYQTGGAWLKTLAEYTTYEATLGSVNYTQALHYLTYLTNKKIFQPESPEARIQILGTLEAADIPFDYLWVMGLDDATWPQAPKPNPFIPQRLQKTLQMPHATAERELIFTRQLTQQLKRSADTVIFSHALQMDDTELRASPLITDLPLITVAELTLAPFVPPAQRIFASSQIEILQDDVAQPLAATESISGGTRIFKHQAECPFKAFAEIRLHANKIEPLTLGLRAKDRGNVVHKALEIVWLDLQDQTKLLALSDNQLQGLIQAAVATALAKIAALTNGNRRYLQLETHRLENLIFRWLQLEKERPHFKIKSLEEKREVSLGKFPLRIRADRIDELESGKHIIIDYKTGKTNPEQDWFGERPDEPQLPLYCILGEDSTIGILFGQLNAEEMKWKGRSGMELDISGVKVNPEWEQQKIDWRRALEKLGDDFYNGQAQVDPKNGEKTCEHCHLPTLCRINEGI